MRWSLDSARGEVSGHLKDDMTWNQVRLLARQFLADTAALAWRLSADLAKRHRDRLVPLATLMIIACASVFMIVQYKEYRFETHVLQQAQNAQPNLAAHVDSSAPAPAEPSTPPQTSFDRPAANLSFAGPVTVSPAPPVTASVVKTSAVLDAKITKFAHAGGMEGPPVQLASVSNRGISAIIDDTPLLVDAAQIRWIEDIVGRNDTLTHLFKRNGIDPKIAYRLVKTPGAGLIGTIYPGDQFNFAKDGEGNLIGVEMRRGKRKKLMAHIDGKQINIIDSQSADQGGSLHAVLKKLYSASAPQAITLEKMATRLPDLSAMDLQWHEVTVRRGDTLSHIFKRIGLPRKEAYELANADGHKWLKSGLRPKQKLRIATSAENEFVAIEVRQRATSRVRMVVSLDGEYLSGTRELESEQQVHEACVTILYNVYEAAKRIGLPRTVADAYTDIFASRIDFSRQLQPNDRMCVIYQQAYVNALAASKPEIIAAALTQKNQELKVFRVKFGTGRVEYYDEHGISVRGHFLRSPIQSARVTSVFTNNRFHPILKRNRAHLGVDYGARTGTPIRATSNGVVTKRAYESGYGRVIKLRHGSKFETLYAHMSKFANGTSVGRYVEQGQIIGYVGSTGLSTGPHLHYEFRVNGVHRDPLTYPMPKGESIPEQSKELFLLLAENLAEKLNGIDQPKLGYIPAETAQQFAIQ